VIGDNKGLRPQGKPFDSFLPLMGLTQLGMQGPIRWPLWLVYAFAVALPLATLLIRMGMDVAFGQRPLLILFLLPIILSAYGGGFGPGMVSTLVAAGSVNYFLIPPIHTFHITQAVDLEQWIILIVNGTFISVLSQALHRSWRRAETERLLQADTLASIGDAVINADLQGRITLLNPEAERLTGWTHQEAVGQPLAAVFRIVNELTREPEEDPASRILESGKMADLANHTVLLARDGRGIPIEESVAPVRRPDGTIVSRVLVFHNCSDKRKAQNALREREEHYRSLFDNMLNGLAYCKMLFEQDEPKDFTYLEVNSAFESLTGLKNVSGKKVSEVIPGLRESDPKLFEIYGRVALTGTPERFETYVEALGMWFSISVYSPQKEYFVAVFDVITERKRARWPWAT